MNKWQRKTLSELMDLSNQMGGSLDYTATSYEKLKDRQRLLMSCSQIVYYVLLDSPENDEQEYGREQVESHLQKMRDASKKIYPDRKGGY